MNDVEQFQAKLQAKLDELKKTDASGTHAKFLWGMLANMCNISCGRNLGVSLTISPFGISSYLDGAIREKSPDDMDYDRRVKRAIIAALENLLFTTGCRLQDLKKDMK